MITIYHFSLLMHLGVACLLVCQRWIIALQAIFWALIVPYPPPAPTLSLFLSLISVCLRILGMFAEIHCWQFTASQCFIPLFLCSQYHAREGYALSSSHSRGTSGIREEGSLQTTSGRLQRVLPLGVGAFYFEVFGKCLLFCRLYTEHRVMTAEILYIKAVWSTRTKH